MNYSDKIRTAREMLGLEKKEFGKLLKISYSYVNQLENPTNKKRLSREKEATIIKAADLPIGYFDEDNIDIIKDENTNEQIVLAMIPEIKAGGHTIESVRKLLKAINETVKASAKTSD